MGACSGKLLDKEYAGYSSSTRSKGSPAFRTRIKHKVAATISTKNVRASDDDNRHGFVIGMGIIITAK